MWFKNLRIYRLTSAFNLDADSLNEALSKGVFSPCKSQDLSRYGWVSPSKPKSNDSDNLVYASQGNLMICAKKQEKVLPAAVINEALEERVAEISKTEGRTIYRKEKQSLKEDVMMSLLPKAFTRSSLVFAYISLKKGYVIINAASANKAEELLSALREAIGSLPVVPLASKQLPHQAMTQWLLNASAPHQFELGEECELADAKEASSIIRCKHQDLSSPEITSHLNTGMIVTKLALNWLEGIDFILDEQLAIKRLRFADNIQEKASDYDNEDSEAQFDIEFSVMTIELDALIDSLLSSLGGISTESLSVEEIVLRTTKTSATQGGVDEVSFAS